MKLLYELFKSIDQHKRTVEVLLPENFNSPLKKLYEIVSARNMIDDNQAMYIIYNGKNLSSFSKLKSRLKEIFINVLLLHNSSFEKESSLVNESISQLRHTLVSKILLGKKDLKLSILIAEKALIKSIKYHSTENTLILARLLIRHYGSSEYNNVKLNKYISIEEKYLRINIWERKAENYFIDLQRTQMHSYALPSEQVKIKAKNYVAELNKSSDIKSYNFIIFKYKVNAAFFEYHNDYNSLLLLSDNMIYELKRSKLSTKTTIQNINIRKAWALIQAGRNVEAIRLASKDMKDMLEGSLGWYFIGHYKLKAQLYNLDYKEATSLVKTMVEEPDFSKIGSTLQELFYTTLGYIHLIVNSGIAGDKNKILKSLPEFKIGKFLNNIPVFSKDKRGINVSILLMHVAILLQRKQYDKIIDRIDSLNQYAYKYLRKDDTFRSNCMIKMVIQMAKADFHPVRTERYTRDLLKQLEQVKLAGSGENIETEIIPYEVLWSIMLKALQPTSRISGK